MNLLVLEEGQYSRFQFEYNSWLLEFLLLSYKSISYWDSYFFMPFYMTIGWLFNLEKSIMRVYFFQDVVPGENSLSYDINPVSGEIKQLGPLFIYQPFERDFSRERMLALPENWNLSHLNATILSEQIGKFFSLISVGSAFLLSFLVFKQEANLYVFHSSYFPVIAFMGMLDLFLAHIQEQLRPPIKLWVHNILSVAFIYLIMKKTFGKILDDSDYLCKNFFELGFFGRLFLSIVGAVCLSVSLLGLLLSLQDKKGREILLNLVTFTLVIFHYLFSLQYFYQLFLIFCLIILRNYYSVSFLSLVGIVCVIELSLKKFIELFRKRPIIHYFGYIDDNYPVQIYIRRIVNTVAWTFVLTYLFSFVKFSLCLLANIMPQPIDQFFSTIVYFMHMFSNWQRILSFIFDMVCIAPLSIPMGIPLPYKSVLSFSIILGFIGYIISLSRLTHLASIIGSHCFFNLLASKISEISIKPSWLRLFFCAITHDQYFSKHTDFSAKSRFQGGQAVTMRYWNLLLVKTKHGSTLMGEHEFLVLEKKGAAIEATTTLRRFDLTDAEGGIINESDWAVRTSPFYYFIWRIPYEQGEQLLTEIRQDKLNFLQKTWRYRMVGQNRLALNEHNCVSWSEMRAASIGCMVRRGLLGAARNVAAHFPIPDQDFPYRAGIVH